MRGVSRDLTLTNLFLVIVRFAIRAFGKMSGLSSRLFLSFPAPHHCTQSQTPSIGAYANAAVNAAVSSIGLPHAVARSIVLPNCCYTGGRTTETLLPHRMLCLMVISCVNSTFALDCRTHKRLNSQRSHLLMICDTGTSSKRISLKSNEPFFETYTKRG